MTETKSGYATTEMWMVIFAGAGITGVMTGSTLADVTIGGGIAITGCAASLAWLVSVYAKARTAAKS